MFGMAGNGHREKSGLYNTSISTFEPPPLPPLPNTPPHQVEKRDGVNVNEIPIFAKYL